MIVIDAGYYRELIRPTIDGRKLILFGAPLARFTSYIGQLAELGAQRPFVVASGVGTGDLPSPDSADWAVLEIDAPDIITEIRMMAAALGSLPADVLARIDAWDPSRTAVALGGPFYTRPTLAGRPVYGGRRPEWADLEDKMLADEIWDAAGVPRVESAIVAAERGALESAAARLDRGSGTVWSGDAREGFNGGAVYVRWIRSPDHRGEAVSFFGNHCDRVRVMPFLEGTPCSIHGVVFPDMTVALRPCELVTLRTPGGSRLVYSGSGCHWDPAAGDAAAMRRAARLVGEHLRRRAGYRGAFTVDGVMTDEGFRPTELNARAGAAMDHVLGAVDGLAFGAIQRALTEDESLDYRPADFEEMILTASAVTRSSVGQQAIPAAATETTTVEVERTDGRLQATDRDPADPVATDAATGDGAGQGVVGSLSFGPGNIGGFVRFVPAGTTPIGPPIAPLVAEALQLADRLWNTGIGPLEPPVPVR